MYAKVFSSLWQGSLGPNWEAWSVFVFLLAHADLEGFVDVHPDYIARCSGIPPDAVRRGLVALESADQSSRSEAQDGRRIERIDAHRDWGWLIVNYSHYRNLQDKDTVRLQTRERVRKHRANPVTDGNGPKRHAEADVEADVEAEAQRLSALPDDKPRPKGSAVLNLRREVSRRFSKPSRAELVVYQVERQALGRPAVDPDRFIAHYESKGWKIGKEPMKDWKATVRTWELTALEREGQATGSRARRIIEFGHKLKQQEGLG